MAEAIKLNTSLTEVYLSFNEITNAGAIALAEAIKSSKILRTVGLHVNLIGDAGIIAIADALKTNKSIQTMYLDNNVFGDVGMIALAEALVGNKILERLDIAYNKDITDKSVPALKLMLETSKIRTMELSVSGTSVSKIAKAELDILLPAPKEQFS